jgi:hypothetical protein
MNPIKNGNADNDLSVLIFCRVWRSSRYGMRKLRLQRIFRDDKRAIIGEG